MRTITSQISALIEQRVGLARSAQARVNLETVVTQAAQGDLAHFLYELENSPENAPIWQQLMSALMIGETYFFRYRSHFHLLRHAILPDIVERRRHRNQSQFYIWSAGCSTGEETYSIAITLREWFSDFSRWNIRLIGNDINHNAIQVAERGVYRSWSFRHNDSSFQHQYFTPLENSWQIKPFIQEIAAFRQSNLLNGPPLPQFDLIFCCNVLLYFDEPHIHLVEDMLLDSLYPGGWLLLGPAEALRFERERWITHIFPGVVAYQKPMGSSQPVLHHDRPTKEAARLLLLPTQPKGYPDAVQALRAKHYDTAEQILADLLSENPNHAPARVLLGCIFANRSALPEAHVQLDTAISLDGMQADAHYLKGVLFLENNQLDAAKDALRAALYCRRGHPLAAMVLGNVYLKDGDFHKARRTWGEALGMIAASEPDKPVSDLSDLTAGSISDFLSEQIRQMS